MRTQVKASAEIVFNGDFYGVTTFSDGGMSYAEPSVSPHHLSPDVDDATLGATLRIALTASKKISAQEFVKLFESRVIHQLGEERAKATMQKYGYKTKRAMYKNMMCCWISMFDNQIEIKPTHHKSIDGYSGISNDGPEIQRVPITISDAELGAALREGFKRCTSAVS